MANDSIRKYIRNMGNDDFSLGSSEYFRRDVSWSATFFIEEFLFANPAGESEVSNHVVFGFVFVYTHHYVL